MQWPLNFGEFHASEREGLAARNGQQLDPMLRTGVRGQEPGILPHYLSIFPGHVAGSPQWQET